MRNPITEIRTKHGASLESWSVLVGVHTQAIYLNECGVYRTVLPALLTYIEGLGFDRASVEADYAAWISYTRQELKDKLDIPEDLPEPSSTKHPFVVFRENFGLSRMAFCKTFLVHPASIYELEHGNMVKLPAQLVDALREVGIPDSLIEELGFRCNEFYVASGAA